MSAGNIRPCLEGANWLERPEAAAVFAALAAGDHDVRAVGGAVRDALLGRPVNDVDLATTARPEDVIRLAEAAGLKAVPTGLVHGTVTVVSGGVPYEVTTLRRDVETDGRRARVTFTTDWAEDARRRDFTINALYCARGGTVFDPLGGYPDLARHRVRFIGDPRARIGEDYLRILRFFRFSAEYGRGPFDADGLRASAELRDGLARLSGERVRAELLRLLAAPRAVEAVTAMAALQILDFLLPSRTLQLFTRLVEIEQALDHPPDPILRLAALAASTGADAERLAERLRLSNAEAGRLAHARGGWPPLGPAKPELEAKAHLYRVGRIAYADGLMLDWARSRDAIDDERRAGHLALTTRWRLPRMPFRGADVVALGVPPGPDIAWVLAAFEAWWIGEGFPTDRKRLAAKLAEFAGRVR